MLKTILLATALTGLAASASAAPGVLALQVQMAQCKGTGGTWTDGKCVRPNQQPQSNQAGNNQKGNNNQADRGRDNNNNNQQAGRGRDDDNRQGNNNRPGDNNNNRPGNGPNNNNGSNGGPDNNRGPQVGNNNNNGRNYNQRDFDRAYYGRYGNDPGNFQRNRQTYRTQQRWHETYYHDYVYADDTFYSQCRNDTNIGGAIIGGLLGGLLGNAVSSGNGGATVAGLIVGGALGATISKNLNCEDRGDMYRTYHDGFERGRANQRYEWRNAKSGHYGYMQVGSYYQDRDGFRCATYSQTIYVNGRPQEAKGHACRQGDGTWAIVD